MVWSSSVVGPEQLSVLGVVAVPAALLLGARLARAGQPGQPGASSREPGRSGAERPPAWWLPVLAGILLLAVVAGDLLPDAVHEAAGLGSPVLLILLPGGLTLALAGAVLWRRGPARGCCTPVTGLVTALALVVHGLAEGLVVGLGVGAGTGAALAAIALVAGHRVAEGFALGTALRGRPRRAARLLVVLAATAPIAGGALGLVAAPSDRWGVVITACLAGLLLAAAARLVAAGAVLLGTRPPAAGPAAVAS